MKKSDFIVVGSGGGGGTIAWVLAKAGFKVTVLEQGPDWPEPVERDEFEFNPRPHDEELYRVRRPDPKRRTRGAYCTFFDASPDKKTKYAIPFDGAWTGVHRGGGSIIWGTWGLRPLPIDLRLKSLFRDLKDDVPNGSEYAVEDWPVSYREFSPYFDMAEAILGVSGSRAEVVESTTNSEWYKALGGLAAFGPPDEWIPSLDFPCAPMPQTPIGAFCGQLVSHEKWNYSPVSLPVSIVSPGSGPYQTRAALDRALEHWPNDLRPECWKGVTGADLWSSRTRQACTQCGYCGEYLCWGREPPKAGVQATTLRELTLDLAENAELRCDAYVYEILWNTDRSRAVGVRYLDISDPDEPRTRELYADNVILSGGAIQSARLLLMSRVPDAGQLGRNAMFHMFGLGIKFRLKGEFKGLLHSEFGPTGNTTTFGTYFIRDKDKPTRWLKAGIVTSTAKKNPTEDAANPFRWPETGAAKPPPLGPDLLGAMSAHCRTMELRFNGDDLPMPENRVSLDPHYVDEYGFPVAQITRRFGGYEQAVNSSGKSLLEAIIAESPAIERESGKNITANDANLALIGDHQMGTCRMGRDPNESVLDEWCRAQHVKNLYVVDTSFFPTSLSVNPMVTVMANALRVGAAIVSGTIPA